MKQHVGGTVIGSIYNLREIYKPNMFQQKYIIVVTTESGEILYAYFNKNNNLKLTKNKHYASSFYKKPRNFNIYSEIIKRKNPKAIVSFKER